jgi:hypothetical protein
MINVGPPLQLDKLSGMPQVGAAFSGWTKNITLVTIKQQVVDSELVETQRTRTFQGVIQPLGDKQLMLKPEGDRAWQWFMIHCVATSLDVDVNDKILYNDAMYKVMKTRDYSLNGYIQYDVILDFQDA